MDGRKLMQRYLDHLMAQIVTERRAADPKAAKTAGRGDLMDAYRTIAIQFGVSESTPRMWSSRGVIPRHVVRQIEATLAGEPIETALEELDLAPAVVTLARDVQKVYDLTEGRGEVWRSLQSTVQLALTWARQGRQPSQRHMRPLPR